MTISTTQNQVSYTGDAVTLAFAFPFPFITTADLKVYVAGVEVLTGFSVIGILPTGGSGTYSSGTVTFVVAPASLATVLIYCDPDQLQSTSIPPNDPFPSKSVEKMVDKVTLLIQRIKVALTGTVRAPTGETIPALPSAADRANKTLGFDASGNPTVLTPVAGSAASVLTMLANGASIAEGDALVAIRRVIAGAVASTLHGWVEGRDLSIFDTMTEADMALVMAGTYSAGLTAKAQAAIDGLQAGQRLHITGTLLLSGAGLNITNKSNIEIVGSGTLSIANAGANVDAVCLKLVGTCDRVKINGLKFIGAGNAGATYLQYGVYNNSGQTLSNVWVQNCYFKSLNAGCAYNADTSGTFTNGFIVNNVFEDMVGTLGGQGYGAFGSKVTNLHIRGNTIRRAQRHSIYVARGSTTPGTTFGTLIHENTIENHRSVGFDGNVRPAIYCIRGSGYSIKNNLIDKYWDCAIGVTHDTVDLTSTGDVIVEGNILTNRQNAVQSVMIGEASNPTAYRTKNVRYANNVHRSDYAVGGNSQEVIVPNGTDIELVGNHLYIANIANVSYRAFAFGQFSAAGATDFDNVLLARNTFVGTISGAAYSPVRLAYVFGNLCSGLARLRIVDNEVASDLLNATAELAAAQTNPRLVVRDQWGGSLGIYVAADTTPSVFGGVNQLVMTNAGAISVTALDDGMPQQRVMLVFTDANTTIVHNANIRLAAGANFVSTSRDTLTLEYNVLYGQWLEVARSVNA